jgi:hypothetical protein
MSDPQAPEGARLLESCVICGHPAVELCVWPQRGTERDFCAECVEAGENEDNFGRCYVCRDFQDHEHCIGVPCQCPCPAPDQRHRAALVESALAKLSPDEIEALRGAGLTP